MLSDLVIDTNVLLHASNPNDPNFVRAKVFLETLLSVSTILCVEEGFSPDRASNRSYIMGEYLDFLRAGTLGLAVIQTLAAKERIKGVERAVDEREAKKIRQRVYDKTDRIFVKVALNTKERVLVSHDFTHFANHVRSSLERDIGVSIIDCNICCPRLTSIRE
jgi:predicted nucleic acid-binding protein